MKKVRQILIINADTIHVHPVHKGTEAGVVSIVPKPLPAFSLFHKKSRKWPGDEARNGCVIARYLGSESD